jgi:hypothetical protein
MTAIGSSTPAFTQSTVSRVALRADIARYEKQRSDCVNCVTAKTPEGKRNIEDLDTRITALKAQLKSVPQAASAAPVDQQASESRGARVRIDVYA